MSSLDLRLGLLGLRLEVVRLVRVVTLARCGASSRPRVTDLALDLRLVEGIKPLNFGFGAQMTPTLNVGKGLH